MSAEENKQIARRFAQVWSAGGLHLLDELASPDIVVHYPMPPEPMVGVETFRSFLRDLYAGMPDVSVSVDEVIAEGEKVACRWTMKGTHDGPLFGFPATGKPVEISGFAHYRIVDGRVVEEKGAGNSIALLQQIGAVISPSQG
jgi:steroid delta-isomerase-like uncharacterized protein